VLAAQGIVQSLQFKHQKISRGILVLCIAIALLQIPVQHQLYGQVEDIHDPAIISSFYEDSAGYDGPVWVSGPHMTSYTDTRVHLLYFPYYSRENVDAMLSSLRETKARVYINSCDLPCPPQENECRDTFEYMITTLDDLGVKEYHQIRGNCEYHIYSS
jgi:hypothetical protein